MISDPAEISRLTSSPNMKDIYVAGNPFTKTHASTYRVAIFNYFRETPGFIDDVSIDGSGPGMVERRHLHDRVFEKPPQTNLQRLQSPASLNSRRDNEPSVAAQGADSQTSGRNTLRKKSNRQRIISLDGARLSHDGVDNKEDLGVREADVASTDSGDDYVRRLMTMREEAGPGWLNVLSQSGGLTGNGGIQEHH